MLDAALAIDAADGGVDLALTVRNDGDAPETLRFRTGQRADFAAYRTDGGDGEAEGGDGCDTAGGGVVDDDVADADTVDGDPVWRYGTGRMFTQALGSETLEPGESATYKATWTDPPPGRYRIVGEVTAEERDPTATAIVEID